MSSKAVPIATWGLSCYRVAEESDFYHLATNSCDNYTILGITYSGQTSYPPGLTGLFCNSFLADTRLQGSGLDFSGNLIHYNGKGLYSYINAVTGSDGTLAVRGVTAARDINIIPDKNVNLALDGLGTYFLNDTGGSIVGYRIDLFGGIGFSACRKFANPIVVGTCNVPSGSCPVYNTK